jgi:transcriptional regulator with XRE-family HTH domain
MQVNISVLIEIGTLDNWQSSIFGRGKELNKLVDKAFWELQKERNLSEYKLAENFKVSRTSIRKWRNGPLQPVPLPLIKALSNHAKIADFLEAIEEVKNYQNSEWLKIPHILTPELSEIVGRHVGDGSITKKTYTVKLVSGNKEFAYKHAKDLESIFGIKPKISFAKDRNYWDVKVNSKPLSVILNTAFEQPIGKKSEIAKEPTLIRNAGLEFEKAFLRGIADTDGSIWKTRTKRGAFSFEIGSVSKILIEDCVRILENLGFRTYVIWQEKKRFSRLRISDNDVGKFQEIVGFNNPDKIYRFSQPQTG